MIRPELQVQRFKSPPNHEVEFGQVNARRLRVTRKDRRVVSGIKHNAFSRVFDEGGVSPAFCIALPRPNASYKYCVEANSSLRLSSEQVRAMYNTPAAGL